MKETAKNLMDDIESSMSDEERKNWEEWKKDFQEHIRNLARNRLSNKKITEELFKKEEKGE